MWGIAMIALITVIIYPRTLFSIRIDIWIQTSDDISYSTILERLILGAKFESGYGNVFFSA